MKGLTIAFITVATLITGAVMPAQAAENGKIDFDQLRRENLDKDAINRDELRRENLEKEDGKIDFDQLRRENLDKDALAQPLPRSIAEVSVL